MKPLVLPQNYKKWIQKYKKGTNKEVNTKKSTKRKSLTPETDTVCQQGYRLLEKRQMYSVHQK